VQVPSPAATPQGAAAAERTPEPHLQEPHPASRRSSVATDSRLLSASPAATTSQSSSSTSHLHVLSVSHSISRPRAVQN